MITIQPTGKVHEAAELFPMLPEDELQELAADIKANGLIHPIVLDDEGALIDGRNRLAACRIVGVEPTYTSLNGHDPASYILSANVARRNLNKGQQALAVARLRLVSKHLSQRQIADMSGLNAGRIGQAETIISHAPELTDAVMSGAVSFDDAYNHARRQKAERETLEDRARHAKRDLEELRANAPELADLVTEERMPLSHAMGAYRERQREEREARARMTKNLWSGLVAVHVGLRSPDPDRVVREWLPGARGLEGMAGTEMLLTPDGLRDLARSLEAFADIVERQPEGVLQ